MIQHGAITIMQEAYAPQFVVEIAACGIRGVGDTLVAALDDLSDNIEDYRLHFLDEPDERLAPDALRIKRWLAQLEPPASTSREER